MMEPKLSTDFYKQEPTLFVAVYGRQLFIQGWFILIPFIGFLIGDGIYSTLKDPEFGWISFVVPLTLLTVVFFRVKYRLIKKLENSPALQRSRILKVYEHCLELEEETGVITTFYLVDISKITPSRNLYHFKLKTTQTFWVPKSAFKSPDDRLAFEQFLREKGKLK